MSKQGVFTYETGWQHAYGIAAATIERRRRGSDDQGRRIEARTASWADQTWDSTSIRIASSVAATS